MFVREPVLSKKVAKKEAERPVKEKMRGRIV